MRIYENCHELLSETYREVVEMGILVKPKSMQNKNVEGNEDFYTKEIRGYQYNLLGLGKQNLLFESLEVRDWAEAEFIERISNAKHGDIDESYYNSDMNINPGKAWLKRKDVWEQFLVFGHDNKPKFDYSYNERINWLDSLDLIIKELIRNPDTRQAVLSIYDKKDVLYIGGKKRIPCSMYYNFHVRQDGDNGLKLNIIYHQRSADVVTHFGNDIWLAWQLMLYVADKIWVRPGNLIHNIDSLHAYKKDWAKLEEMRNKLPERSKRLEE